MPLPIVEEKLATQIVAIAAGKGGVGKSTVTVQLALALQRQGKQVGILDADLYGPSIEALLPAQVRPRQVGNSLAPATASGIAVVTMAHFQKGGAVVRAPIANRVIGQFLQGVAWGGLDWLLIDFPPGTGDIPLTVGQQAPLAGAVMVTTGHALSLLDVEKAMGLFDKVGVPVWGVVENMSGEPFGRGGGRILAERQGVPFLGEIPMDAQLAQEGCPGESKNAFEALARQLK